MAYSRGVFGGYGTRFGDGQDDVAGNNMFDSWILEVYEEKAEKNSFKLFRKMFVFEKTK